MKLRIRADSLRLRLTRTEIDQLREAGRVAQTIHFGPEAALEYAIELADVDRVQASFEAARILVALPRGVGLAWANGDQVGIAATQALDEGELAISIEKDFQCLAPRGEQDDDAFPHPEAETGASC